MSALSFGSLFSGIGGFDLGFERAGMRCAWQCEADRACRSILRRIQPPTAPDAAGLSAQIRALPCEPENRYASAARLAEHLPTYRLGFSDALATAAELAVAAEAREAALLYERHALRLLALELAKELTKSCPDPEHGRQVAELERQLGLTSTTETRS